MTILQIEKFYVIGISVRTTNENGQAAHDLELLWKKFWSDEILHQIPNKINDEIYAVYTDYEADFTKPYTTIIGAAVTSLADVPNQFVGIEIEKTRYEKYASNGKMPEAVFNTWQEIWSDQELNSRRVYKADFTIHGKKYFDGDNAEVETFLSVK